MTANPDDPGGTNGDGDPGARKRGGGDDDRVRVWLVERTFSDDEQNIVILVYATPDGERYLRKERALTSFSGPARETPASVEADPVNLGTATDPETRERYATEARRMADRYDPGEAI